MQLEAAFEEYLLAIHGLGSETQRWYRIKLTAFMTWARNHYHTELEELTASDLRRFLVSLEEERKMEDVTLHGYARALKAFFSFCERDDLLTRNPMDKVAMPKTTVHLISTLSTAHIQALMKAARTSRAPMRNQAILCVLLETGVRASELCGLTLENTHLENARDPYLYVLGKGKRERAVGLGPQCRLILSRYLLREREAGRTPNTFLSWGARPMRVRGLEALILKLNEQAGITGVRVSPHTFRHTFALTYLREGGDLYRLSRLLGHSTIQVTEHYLRDFRQEDARKAGISVLEALWGRDH